MKAVVSSLAAALALIWLVPDDASAQSRGARQKAKQKVKVVRVAQRPPSVGPNGLCQRDTGTPMDKLNFRNRCDVEEFWNRIMERGSDIGR